MTSKTPTFTSEKWKELCRQTRELVPVEIGLDAWYLIIASALLTSPSPHLLGEFSTFLRSGEQQQQQEQPPSSEIESEFGFSTVESQDRLSLRLRDVCLKLLTLIGAPAVLSGLMPLAEAEGDMETRAQRSELSEKWKSINTSQIYNRGVSTITSIYDSRFLPQIFAKWGNHRADMEFNELFTVYGLYLSDFEVMTPVETEAVVFTCIVCQGLRGPALWHMRGMGRILGARQPRDEGKRGGGNVNEIGGEIDSDNKNRNKNEKDGDGDGDGDGIDLSKIEEQLDSLRAALVGIVEWVGPEFEARARVDSWCRVDDVQRELGGWGGD